MITYDYVIDRNMGKGKTRRFRPNRIPTRLKNVVVIEGPNSSAKSTLLNIISLGLFGTKSSKINPMLQTKLHSLLDQKHQKIRFSFQITSDNEKIILKSEKDDIDGTEIIVEESIDGKKFHPLSFESFQRKYNLIYDIPSNPIERLPELLKELKDEQLQFGSDFKNFGFYLRGIITEINSSRNPKRLKELEKKLSEASKKREIIVEELPDLETFLDQLEKNAYYEYYYDYSIRGEGLAKKIHKLKTKIKAHALDGKRINLRLSKKRAKVAHLRTEFTEDYKEVTPLIQNTLPKNERSRFKIWKDVNPYCTERNELNTVIIEDIHYQDLFTKEIDDLKKDRSFINARSMEKLFQALNEFEDSMFMIPELEVTIGELVAILKKEIDASSILIKKYNVMTEIIGKLKNLKTTIEDLQRTQEDLEQESIASDDVAGKIIDEFDEKSRELEKMENDLIYYATQCNEYCQRCISKGINLEKLENLTYKEIVKEIPKNVKINQYLSLGEKQVLEKIKNLQSEIVDKRGELSGLKIVISQHKKDIKSLESQEPHRFEKYVELLIPLLRKTEAISQKILSQYNTNLKNLINKKVKKDQKLKKHELKYYDEVSKYLAHRIGYFRHIGEVYKAEVVDLISETIFTDKGEIYIPYMGTGESQSAYILSVLNIKNDNRKIIALFDEIAMMDSKSLKPIYSRLQELYESTQLLLGILVQRSENLTVTELV